MLKLQLFTNDALAEMKAFELELKKKKQSIKKTDAEIVVITIDIRIKKYTPDKKILY